MIENFLTDVMRKNIFQLLKDSNKFIKVDDLNKVLHSTPTEVDRTIWLSPLPAHLLSKKSDLIKFF